MGSGLGQRCSWRYLLCPPRKRAYSKEAVYSDKLQHYSTGRGEQGENGQGERLGGFVLVGRRAEGGKMMIKEQSNSSRWYPALASIASTGKPHLHPSGEASQVLLPPFGGLSAWDEWD